jgi:hypothetical protein
VADYDPATRPSRGAWRDRYGAYLERERATRERLDRARQAYRDQLQADCAHGPRVRKIGEQDGRPFAMLVCPLGNAGCGIAYPNVDMVFRQWRDGQDQSDGNPLTPGNVGTA